MDKKIIIIDNYDSFTFNLVHQVENITGIMPDVFRNDEISLEDLEKYDMLLLSPGPGIPDEAGLLKEIIKTYAVKKPMFGVCLGLQAIVEVFGGSLLNLEEVFHGVATEMEVVNEDAILYKDITNPFLAARYHSWIADTSTLPNELMVTSIDEENNIMSIQHESLPIHAVQYHPESILTEVGEQIVRNFIEHYSK